MEPGPNYCCGCIKRNHYISSVYNTGQKSTLVRASKLSCGRLCMARGYGCIWLWILHAFISDLATTRAEASLSPETAGVQQRNSMLRHFIDCLVQEYEAARFSDSVSSYRMRHLLLPHMEAHLQVGGLYSGGCILPRYCLWQPIGVK